jgi:hypothetical protein
MNRKSLDSRTLRCVARELIGLAEAFYQAPVSLPEYRKLDMARGDILSARGRIYLKEANRLARAEQKARAVESKGRKVKSR